MKERKESGFTLIELLVVILIIAILAAIAIPVFLNQRKKGWASQSQSALKNAATAIETCATDFGGDYTQCRAAAAGTETDLAGNGFSPTANVTVTFTSTATAYCLSAAHALHPDVWAIGTYGSSTGAPTEDDACTPVTG